MQTAATPLDHMYAIVSLDILEMEKIAQVNNKEMWSWMISFRSFSLSLFVCRVLCSRGIIRAVNSVCFSWYLLYLREKISKIAVWLTGPARESHETRKLQTSILLFSYMYLYDSWIKTKSHFSFFSLFFSFILKDIDECIAYPDKCHVNATCNNTDGSHVCSCKPGYIGDGRSCTGTFNNLKSFQILFDNYNEFCTFCTIPWKAKI